MSFDRLLPIALLFVLISLIAAPPALAADRDGDGVEDAMDNCLFQANVDQRDSDRDGFGNLCDADLNGDGVTTLIDFAGFRSAFRSSDADADFDGDGVVGTADFGHFLRMFGHPPGPGAVLADREPILCNGGFCTIYVVPGVEIDVPQGGFVARADGDFEVSGDIEIYTPEGGVGMGDVDLVVTPGVGMVGRSDSPDYSIGILEGSPSTLVPNRVDVITARGRELDLEIPLWEDVYYVVFSDGAFVNGSFETGIGDLRWVVGPQSWRLVLDPVDPFVYVGSDVAIPVLTGRSLLSLEFQEIGRGIGISLGGRIPFTPNVPVAIEEVLPEVKGDTVYYASFDALAALPLEARVEGIVITDEDPDGNGARLFGSDEASARDYRRVVQGTLSTSASISILPGLSFDLNANPELGLGAETPPLTLVSSLVGVGTPGQRRESWLSLDLPDLASVQQASNGWLDLPTERTASVFYFGNDSNENFFRSATEQVMTIDSARMAASHGVQASVLAISQSIIDIDRNAIEVTSESFARSIHPDVEFIQDSRTHLVLPTSDELDFDLTIETESRIGGHTLRQYGMQLTLDAYRHWGRFETENFAYELAGSFSDEGAWLEGAATAPLPYRYPVVDRVADIAGRIAAQDQVAALAQQELDVRLDTLADLEADLRTAASDVSNARDDLAGARSWLSQKRRELRNVENRNCGTCAWYDAVCWAEVAACNAWKAVTAPALEKVVSTAVAGVSALEATLSRLERGYDELEILVGGARLAAETALAARDEAQLALVLLRAERDALPLEDGVIDATIRLRLTRGGFTGTVSGTFAGVDFGEGQILDDDVSGPRACFIVPQTGEELCTRL